MDWPRPRRRRWRVGRAGIAALDHAHLAGHLAGHLALDVCVTRSPVASPTRPSPPVIRSWPLDADIGRQSDRYRPGRGMGYKSWSPRGLRSRCRSTRRGAGRVGAPAMSGTSSARGTRRSPARPAPRPPRCPPRRPGRQPQPRAPRSSGATMAPPLRRGTGPEAGLSGAMAHRNRRMRALWEGLQGCGCLAFSRRGSSIAMSRACGHPPALITEESPDN